MALKRIAEQIFHASRGGGKRILGDLYRGVKTSLYTIFVHEYVATVELVAKSIWPLSLVVSLLLFSEPIGNLFNRVDKLVVREAIEAVFRDTEIQTINAFKKLSRDEIELVIWMAGRPVNVPGTKFVDVNKDVLLALEEYGFIKFEGSNKQKVPLEQAVKVVSTDSGRAFYDDIRVHMINRYLESVRNKVQEDGSSSE